MYTLDGEIRFAGRRGMEGRTVGRGRPAAGGILASAAAFALLLVAAPASAQSNAYVCNELAARLAAASKMPASKADRWASAIAEQRAAIEQNRASLSRCGGGWDPRCAAIATRGQQMAANLDNLERQYARLGGDRATGSPEKARLQAMMAQMRCGERDSVAPAGSAASTMPPGVPSRVTINGQPPGGRMTAADVPVGAGPARVRTAPSGPAGFFAALFGVPVGPAPGEETIEEDVDPGLADDLSGSFRTLCVRTCDGYFFPISFNAPKGRLATDTNVCRALCPGTETRLYFHHNPGEEAEQAIAADNGEPLTRLPNAFRYRTQMVPACACGKPDPSLLPAAAGGLRGTREAAQRAFSLADLPIPLPRPPTDEDPETVADLLAGFEPGETVPIAAEETPPAKVARGVAEPPKVRTVGPKYFSDR
jgi:hypothetical protein